VSLPVAGEVVDRLGVAAASRLGSEAAELLGTIGAMDDLDELESTDADQRFVASRPLFCGPGRRSVRGMMADSRMSGGDLAVSPLNPS
jgi:hypothetical protein